VVLPDRSCLQAAGVVLFLAAQRSAAHMRHHCIASTFWDVTMGVSKVHWPPYYDTESAAAVTVRGGLWTHTIPTCAAETVGWAPKVLFDRQGLPQSTSQSAQTCPISLMHSHLNSCRASSHGICTVLLLMESRHSKHHLASCVPTLHLLVCCCHF
jgi:hypothetical protein